MDTESLPINSRRPNSSKLLARRKADARLLHCILAELGTTTALNCLEISSGEWAASAYLHRSGGSWTSAVFNKAGAAALRRQGRRQIFQFSKAGAPFQAHSFDRILITGGWDQITEPRLFFDEVHRILAPGGQVLISLPLYPALLKKLDLAATGQHGPELALPGGSFKLLSQRACRLAARPGRGQSAAPEEELHLSRPDTPRASALAEAASRLGSLDALLYFHSGDQLVARFEGIQPPAQSRQAEQGSQHAETPDLESSSDAYARRFSGKAGRWFLEVQEAATLAMLADYPGASVLDVGGGHGQTAEALVRSGYALTVLGSAEVYSERVRGLVEQGRLEFKTGSLLNLPFPDRSFDVVISYRMLPHLVRWDLFLAELARVARRAVLVDYPERLSLNALTPLMFSFKKRLEGSTRPYTTFRRRELARALAAHGFTPAERYPQFFLPMVLHRGLEAPHLSERLEGLFRRAGLTNQFGSPVIHKFTRADPG